jgi:protein-tyrosine phosphatase
MSWLSRRQRDGGLDRVGLPPAVPGALWLCGKHAIGPDHHALIAEVGGAATVVCLTERHELADRYPAYVAWLDDPAMRSLWFPIHDLDAPWLDDMVAWVDQLTARLFEGETLVVHCAAGKGRSGTTAACVLVALGAEVEEALAKVAEARPGAGPEVGAQRELVERLAQRLREGSQPPR